MYTHRSGLGGGIGDIFGGIGEAIGDWIRRQTGLPTSAEERAMLTQQMQTQQALSAQREINIQQILAKKDVQTAMITGAAVISGIALYFALRRK